MSLRSILGIVAAVLVAVFFSTNYIVAWILAERLPRALTDAEGMPVTISNLRANIWRKRIYADDLVYGPADRPLLVFNSLYVQLDLSDLLTGVITLDSAGSESVDLHISRFADTPGETEFSEASPFVPKFIEVGKAQFWENDQLFRTATEFTWLVTSVKGRRAEWIENRGGKSLRFVLQSDDHYEILNADRADLAFSVALVGEEEPFLTGQFTSRPSDAGFEAEIIATARSFQASLTYQTNWLFELPTRSRLLVQKVDSDDLAELSPLFAANPQISSESKPDRRAILRAPLPTLNLPDHHLGVRSD